MPTHIVQPDHVFTHAFDNRLDEIAQLADALEQWASEMRVPQATIGSINLMLDELITNVVTYGYPAMQHGEILVKAWVSPGRLDVQLRDHAFAYNPLAASEPDLQAGIDERAIGGLGVHFVRQLADEVTYERANENGKETNLVHIVKRFSHPSDQTL